MDIKGQGDEWGQVACYEIHKVSITGFFFKREEEKGVRERRST